MKKLTFILLFASSLLNATENSVIKGLIANSELTPQPFAIVLLKNSKDSTLSKGEISNDKGEFYFDQIKQGSYFLEIQMTGFQKKNIPNIIIPEQDSLIDLKTIVLEPHSTDLKEISVVADKPFIEQQVDKTVVNIENSIIQNGSSIMEVIEKLPGVIVDQNGNISIKGKQGVIVMIDGKRTALSGQDLSSMLKSMASSNIQKIEIITNPSAKYDAAGNAGIINIVMKKNRRDGLNGSITAGYGQGRYPKYNGSINLNYKEKKYNLFFNYNYSKRLGFNHLSIDRKFYGADTINTVFRTENYILFPSENHSPRIGADLYISPKTTLSFLGTGGITQFNPSTSDHTNIINGNDQLIQSYDFTNSSQEQFYNYAFNIELKHQFDSIGQELVFDLDYANYVSGSDQYFSTSYYNSNGIFTNEDILSSNQLSTLQLYSAKADYTKPLKKAYQLEAGIKSSYVSSDNDIAFYNKINNSSIFDSARSSHFLYAENINAAYLSMRKEYKRFSYQLGLRTEQTVARGKQILNSKTFNRNYAQIFPTAYFDLKLSEKNNINLSLGRRIDRPAYEQMNPYRSLINATTFSEGNPYLLPQLTYNIEFTYSYNNMFFANLTYSLTTDNITDVLIQDSQTQTTVQTIANLDQLNFYSLNLTFSKKMNKWWTTNTSILSYYGLYTGNINNNHIRQGAPSFYLNSGNSFFIMEGLSMEANFILNYKNVYGITTMNTTYNFSLGVQKSILKNKGSITVNMSDIFWKAYPSGVTEFDNVREDWTAKRDTRVLNVSFTYKFGKGKASRLRRNTGADDEKSRIQKQ